MQILWLFWLICHYEADFNSKPDTFIIRVSVHASVVTLHAATREFYYANVKRNYNHKKTEHKENHLAPVFQMDSLCSLETFLPLKSACKLSFTLSLTFILTNLIYE